MIGQTSMMWSSGLYWMRSESCLKTTGVLHRLLGRMNSAWIALTSGVTVNDIFPFRLFPFSRHRVPVLCCASMCGSSLLHTTQQNYKAKRFFFNELKVS